VTAAGATISLLTGAVLLRLTLTHDYLRYVRPEMGPFVAVAGVVVILVGLAALLLALRRTEVAPHDHDHGHGEGVGVGWLLLAPIAALLLVAPPTLGSYGVGRAATIDIKAGKTTFDPLPRGAPPRPMTLLEFVQRGYDHDGATFNRATIRLTGFVAGTEDGGFQLARYQIACCAADAQPVVVDVVGSSGDALARDQWVEVTGTFRPGGGDVPQLAATSIAEIPAPEDPYE
jgi:uncharacterized repeat protein (TIGR03943 family)